MRDDFSEDVKRTLAARVNYLCSNPDCQAPTSGPQDDPAKAVNLGVAAHITAASEGGPRFNSSLSSEDRRHADNGIWLCQNCAKLIDSDVSRFSEPLLRAWKIVAEDRARDSLGKTAAQTTAKASPILKLFLETKGITTDIYRPFYLVREYVLGLTNGVGCASARFPSLHYRRSCGLRVNHFGIDGCHGFGLPHAPSESEWETFRGGVDHVIHPGDTVKITTLFQDGRTEKDSPLLVRSNAVVPLSPQWFFDAVDFQYEISAEGMPKVASVERLPEYSTQSKLPTHV